MRLILFHLAIEINAACIFQLIFFLGEGVCLLCAVLYYNYCTVERVGANVRHLVALFVGIAVGTLSFGW
ncbi:hypothetical protein DPMN_072597 [Dreissena polymorpha]|uniref:Uncharacterized protein n=1 Tax=Dreissena polymorpha TaxID=45954 RepID=A0A9D4BXK6_DREPO|nr:hypothetical protein DPMN_072597 [Dreissena polymorpha]